MKVLHGAGAVKARTDLVGIVTGVATCKYDSRDVTKLRLVKACDLDGKATGAVLVCADAVGAGLGDVVLYASGSSARQTKQTKDRPVDATIMAIVDVVESDGQQRYVKD